MAKGAKRGPRQPATAPSPGDSLGELASAVLDTLLFTAPLGFAVLDRDLRYLLVNPALAEVNGLPVAAHLGRSLREVVPQLADTLEPVFRDVLSSGSPVRELELSGELRGRPGDLRHWLESVYPVPGPAGDVAVAVAVVVWDITERRRTEAERDRLLASESRARARAELLAALGTATGGAADSTAVADTVIDALAGLLRASAAMVYGHVRGDEYRLLASRGLPEEVLAAWEVLHAEPDLPLGAALTSGRPVVFGSLAERDRRYRRLAGVPVRQQAWAHLPLLVEGRPVGFVAFGWDDARDFAGDDVALLAAVAGQCAIALDRGRLFDAEHAARADAQVAGARQALLQRLTAALAGASDVAQVARVVVEIAPAAMGASAATIASFEAPDTLRVLAATGLPPEVTARLARFRAGDLPMAADVLAGEPVLIPSTAERNRRYPDMASWPVLQEAWANLPLILDGRPVGQASFGWSEPRTFSPDEVEVLQAIAGQCATALERARLLDAERSARASAERAQARLQLLAEASGLLTSATDERRLLAQLCELPAGRLADCCSVLLPDEAGRLRWQVGHAPDPTSIESPPGRPVPALDPRDPRAIAWRTGVSSRVERLPDAPATSMVAVPLPARGSTLGVLAAIRSHGPGFTAEDEELLVDLGRRAGAALDNLRLLAARTRVAARLQESLLPAQLPRVPGVELAVRYLAAEQAAEVGGDFYDVFPVSDREYALVIGDVAGRGVDAAGYTGLARTMLQALDPGLGPAAALQRLNSLLLPRTGPELFLTAAYLRLRLVGDGAAITVCCAGHPLPLLRRADGGVVPVGVPGPLLGIFDSLALEERTADLAPGDALLLYTDGVIEAHGEDGLFGDERLAAVVAATAGESADRLAQAVESAVLDHRIGGADDMAVLALRVSPRIRSGEVALVDTRLPAEPASAEVACRLVREATAELVPAEVREGLLVAVTELVSDAVRALSAEPGGGLRTHPVSLRVVQRHADLHVEVGRPSSGVPPAADREPAECGAGGGLGRGVVPTLTRDFGIIAHAGTTRVWFRLPVPAR